MNYGSCQDAGFSGNYQLEKGYALTKFTGPYPPSIASSVWLYYYSVSFWQQTADSMPADYKGAGNAPVNYFGDTCPDVKKIYIYVLLVFWVIASF